MTTTTSVPPAIVSTAPAAGSVAGDSLHGSHLLRGERILTLDVLRGWALLGIFFAHMIYWFAGGPLPQEMYSAHKDIGSGLAMGFYFLFVIGKFFSLFSFLFGLSFYIQIRSLVQRHENVIKRFGWRLCILGLIGLLHHAVWRADILSIYVPLGFILLLLRDISNRTLLILGILLVLNIPTKLAEVVAIIVRGKTELIPFDLAAAGAAYHDVLKQGSFIDNLHHNIGVFGDKWVYQINSGRVWITLGFFFLGMLAGRLRIFENLEANQPLLKSGWKKAGMIILACILLGIVAGVGLYLAGVEVENSPWIIWAGGFVWEIFSLSLTSFYILSVTLLMLKPRWQRRFAPLALAGKMALSVYLLQTFCGLLLFYAFGLGLFGVTSPAVNTLLCLGIFALLMVFCRLWLQYFTYGPVEWLWRSATVLRWQPLRKQKLNPTP